MFTHDNNKELLIINMNIYKYINIKIINFVYK